MIYIVNVDNSLNQLEVLQKLIADKNIKDKNENTVREPLFCDTDMV